MIYSSSVFGDDAFSYRKATEKTKSFVVTSFVARLTQIGFHLRSLRLLLFKFWRCFTANSFRASFATNFLN